MSRASDLLLDDGSIAVVKTARGPSAASDLRQEGERLRAAAHRGVVEVLRSAGDDEEWELRLVHGGRPVHLLHPAPPAQIARVAGSVAEVLGDLHERGITHGRLRSDHVLVGPGGRVRLCGFGPGSGDAGPEDDVAALGALVVELLGDREQVEPLPDARWHRRRPWSGVARRSLLALADAASAEPPTRRPTARRLARLIDEAVPEARDPRWSLLEEPRARLSWSSRGAALAALAAGPREEHLVEPPSRELDERPVPRGGETNRGRRPRVSAKPVILATLGAGLLVLSLVLPGPSDDAVQPSASEGAASDPCAVLGRAAGGGPCRGPVRVEGRVVVVGTDRFEVGTVGDEVVVGDWDCDGAVTPAVLRPSTGEVFVFHGWATSEDLRVDPEVRVARAIDIVAPDGCGPPVVERVDGSLYATSLGGAST